MKILRVFVRRTSQTPIDDYVRIGSPDLFIPKDIQQIRISVLFTWDKQQAIELKKDYAARFPNIPLKIGGPAFCSAVGEFKAGRYTKSGITILSRGCNFNCPWCLVSKIEGEFWELYGLEPGNIIQDNNILLSSKGRLRRIFEMLKHQKGIRFVGGLDVRLLEDWHIQELRALRIKELWLAFDSWVNKKEFIRATEKLKKAGFNRNQIRCYVLAGFDESIQMSEDRLKFVYNYGALPYIQVYQLPKNLKRMSGEQSREDNLFVRRWSRPAIIKAMCQE